MNKLKDLLVTPSDGLKFKGSFSDYVSNKITVENAADHCIAFKVMTTHPKSYQVKPSVGVLSGHEALELTVNLVPFEYNPSETYNHQIQIVYVHLEEENRKLTIDEIKKMWGTIVQKPIMNVKLKCVLEPTILLNPYNELKFKGSFNDFVPTTLTIRNATNNSIVFKVMSTHQKLYCVKPNAGLLNEHENLQLSIICAPFECSPNEKYNHKFMIKYVELTDEESQSVIVERENILKWIDTLSQDRFESTILKCTLEPTENTLKPKNTSKYGTWIKKGSFILAGGIVITTLILLKTNILNKK